MQNSPHQLNSCCIFLRNLFFFVGSGAAEAALWGQRALAVTICTPETTPRNGRVAEIFVYDNFARKVRWGGCWSYVLGSGDCSLCSFARRG